MGGSVCVFKTINTVMKKDPLAFRKQFEPKIIEFTKQADKYCKEFIINNDLVALSKYRYFVREIIKLKDYIVEQENKEDKE